MKNPRKSSTLRCAALAGLLIAGLCASVERTIAAEFSQDAVKAAFLYRFAGYVEWPEDARSPAAFTIAVIGGDGVYAALEKLRPATIQELPARVVKVATGADLNGADILYVGPGAFAVAEKLLAASPSRPMLIVSDSEDRFRGDSVINFVRVGPNVRFEVSLIAAERRQLKVSSGLLSVAARVEGRPRAGILCVSHRDSASKCHTLFSLLAKVRRSTALLRIG
jgi:YfiR/HmsC-like